MVPIVIVTALLTPLTWARNTDWASDVLLAESDYRRGEQQGRILQAMVEHNLAAGNTSRAVEICDLHANATPGNWYLCNNCGSAYASAGRYQDAEKAFLLAMNKPEGTAKAHFTLARMYLELGRRSEAKTQFKQAIAVEDQPFLKEFNTGFMLIELYPLDRSKLLEARTHFERSLQLQPQYFPARRILHQLNEFLRPRQRTED
jgi:tetratricopeptide (TPR) repeat protein